MNMRTVRVLFLSVLLMGALGGYAQGGTHWQCDIYGYQYGMSVFFNLQKNVSIVKNLDDYEVAAFVSSDCRGVGEVLVTSSGTVYGYLRVRSNVTTGEQVSFKVYQKSTGKVVDVYETLEFVDQEAKGLPSSPYTMKFDLILLGDVNDDDIVDIADAVCVVNHIVGKATPVFIEGAADVNKDGDIDIADAVRIVNLIVGKINALARQRNSVTLCEPE